MLSEDLPLTPSGSAVVCRSPFAILLPRLVLIAILCYCAAWAISLALTRPLAFDGGMNVQIAANLVDHGQYATSYGNQRLFDPRVQTGAPFLLPVAVLFGLFGPSIEAALLVNALYLIAFFGLAATYVLLRSQSWLAASICVLLLALTPTLAPTGVGGYGEIPALFYILLGLVALERLQSTGKTRWSIILGISIALAYLTKTVALIALPALGAITAYDLWRGKVFQKRDYRIAIASFILTVLLFELYRLQQLGLSDFSSWWSHTLKQVFQQAGVTRYYADTPGFSHKLLVHWGRLTSSFEYPALAAAAVLSLSLVICPALTLFKRPLLPRLSYSEWALILLTLTYFVWWCAISSTQKAYPRRLVDGVLLLQICGILAAASLITRRRPQEQASSSCFSLSCCSLTRVGAVAIALLLLTSLCWSRAQTLDALALSLQPHPEKLAAARTAAEVKKLAASGAVMYGHGWWQAPVISFVAGVPMQDLSLRTAATTSTSTPKYLIVDRYFSSLNTRQLDRLLREWTHTLVFQEHANRIYLLHAYQGNEPFTRKDISACVSPSLDLKGDISRCTRGLYPYETSNRGCWLMPRSNILLRRQNESVLQLKLYVPPLRNYASPPRLHLWVNNQPAQNLPLTEGPMSLECRLPQTVPTNAVVEVCLDFSSSVAAGSDDRELAAVLRSISLAAETAASVAPQPATGRSR